ncbi:hypothetical protein [Parabacteroides sp. AM08-6]|uniref:hypothetical protein n=1 Tax=Parabacteroides sp. AM08-6 TaxID=2292053 RepID=UPI000EFFA4DF|nr:hypothetical protein [Parabacteroides sp. AM08-6]RHJ78083.1 hypothetical protein DW103_15235 [Parabacteroides sp. AM08-6]
MSRKSSIVTVEPPAYTTDAEKLEIAGFECPYCCGQGKWSEEVGRNVYVEHTCRVCKGVKELKAIITIGWLPNIKPE